MRTGRRSRRRAGSAAEAADPARRPGAGATAEWISSWPETRSRRGEPFRVRPPSPRCRESLSPLRAGRSRHSRARHGRTAGESGPRRCNIQNTGSRSRDRTRTRGVDRGLPVPYPPYTPCSYILPGSGFAHAVATPGRRISNGFVTRRPRGRPGSFKWCGGIPAAKISGFGDERDERPFMPRTGMRIRTSRASRRIGAGSCGAG